MTDQTVRAITSFVDFVTTVAERQLQHRSDFGTFGVAGDRPISGWACALFVDAHSTTFTVIVFPAANLPNVQSATTAYVLLVAVSTSTTTNLAITLDLVGRVAIRRLVVADVREGVALGGEKLIVGL